MMGSTKYQILKHKIFKYKDYVIEAFESEKPTHYFEKYENVILFDNIKTNEINELETHFQNSIENRKLLKTVQSIICDNLVFLKVDGDLNFDKFKKRLENRLSLNKLYYIHEAFETLSIMVKLDRKKLNEIYLNENFKQKSQMYWQVPFELHDSPFVIVKFSNIEFKFEFLVKYSEKEKKEFLIENIFNVDILNEYLNKFELQMKKNNKQFDSSKYPVDTISVQEWSNGNTSNVKSNKKSTKFKCKICPFVSYTEYRQLAHERQHEFKKGAFKCQYCSYFTKMKCHVKVHEKLHLNE
jgi:hypothetical protein